jgi:hypothetical protein
MIEQTDVEIHLAGIQLKELRLPGGYWILADDDDNAFVSGKHCSDVCSAATELGLDLEKLGLDKAPSNDGDFALGGAGLKIE